MDLARIQRIRSSFDLVAPRAGDLMDTFYNLLFSRHPQVRAMFPQDMSKQKQHLAAAVGLVVKHADNLAAIEPALLEMGARHVSYGAKPEHYPIVATTMLDALAKVAGPVWTDQLKGDWGWALGAVAEVMMRGAKQVQPGTGAGQMRKAA